MNNVTVSAYASEPAPTQNPANILGGLATNI